MVIVKDSRLAIRKYYLFIDMVIILVFIISNIFVAMSFMKTDFYTGYDEQFRSSERIFFNYAKSYPGFLYIFKSFCAPGFFLVNNVSHELFNFSIILVEFIQNNFGTPENMPTFIKIIKSLIASAKVCENIALKFPANAVYSYSIAEIIICINAIFYGWLMRCLLHFIHFMLK
ncbi:MAG: hypothetical protein LBE20_07495 [Deltaproteobacteria bacterium]|jgi:hypothetical protein|nr:hypothetical protein [Deltaproteobacteria bacterium]